jgi:hypothetical protein
VKDWELHLALNDPADPIHDDIHEALGMITRQEAAGTAQAHAEGSHTPPDGVPCEGCPECEGRDSRSYTRATDGKDKRR